MSVCVCINCANSTIKWEIFECMTRRHNTLSRCCSLPGNLQHIGSSWCIPSTINSYEIGNGGTKLIKLRYKAASQIQEEEEKHATTKKRKTIRKIAVAQCWKCKALFSSIYWLNLLANNRHPSKSSHLIISAISNYAKIDDNILYIIMELYAHTRAKTKTSIHTHTQTQTQTRRLSNVSRMVHVDSAFFVFVIFKCFTPINSFCKRRAKEAKKN